MTNPPMPDRWKLANRHFNDRNLVAAAAECHAILQRLPADPFANWLLSMIHIEAGKPRLAAQYAMEASRAAARLPIADLLKVSWALVVTGEGARAAELLLAIDPADPAMRPGLWGAARQLGLLELHVPALRLLDAIPPAQRNTSVTTLRGHLLSVFGREDDAVASFEATLVADPVSPLAHLMLSRLGLAEGRGQRIERVRRLLQRLPSDLDHQAMLHYALFGEFDAIGDIDPAWRSLAAGAEARRRLLPYDAAQEDRIFDRLIATTGTDFLEHADVDASRDAPVPIFIVGMPRTGTTVLERILGNHPDVRPCGELTAFVQQHHWASDRVWNGMFDERAASGQAGIDAGLLGKRYLDAVNWRIGGKRYFSDKTPGNFMAAALILKAMPQARIIHLRRDPMDACFSNLKVLFANDVYPYSSSLEGLARHHGNYSRLMQHWHRVFPGRILDVDYEVLVRDSAGQARRILDYCGLAPRDGINDLTANQASVSTESRSQVREPIHQRNIGGWRRYAAQLAPLERMLQAH